MSGVERPRRTRVRSVALNTSIILGTTMSAAMASSSADLRDHPDWAEAHASGHILTFTMSVGCAVLLCFRHRTGWLLPAAVASCLPPLLVPTDAVPALVGLASVMVWVRPVLPRIGIAVLATAATAASIWRDSRGTRPGASFWSSLFHAQTEKSWPPMPLWLVAVFTVLCVGVAMGIATLRRARRDAVQQRTRASMASQQVQTLGHRVAESDEREALAREVHDVLGHRLSILSMQASALEVEAAGADEELRERARAIQAGAAGSMDDLRSLLHMLRSGPAPTQRPADLADIADLVRECIDAGTPVSSSIFVDRSSPLDDVVSRSAHRVTAELLTNARKHAPHCQVVLEIRGDPTSGLMISTTNPLTAQPPGPGSGSGLVGVGRRVYDLGGHFTAGPSPDGRYFHARAVLPWRLPHQERR